METILRRPALRSTVRLAAAPPAAAAMTWPWQPQVQKGMWAKEMLGGVLFAGLAFLLAFNPAALQTRGTPSGNAGNSDAAQAQVPTPQWQVGDRWTVETTSRQIQARHPTGGQQQTQKLQWQFSVAGTDRLADRDCHRVEVTCQAQGQQQPTVTFWVDQKTQVLRQVQTRLPTVGGFRTMTESFDFPDGRQSPVLPALTALPIDLPAFVQGQAKESGKFTYESVSGPAGTKDPGALGFLVEVEQQVAAADAEGVKGLLADDFAKNLEERPVVEVKIHGARRQVRQLWQRGAPWPVYSDNGTTSARLVKVSLKSRTER
ncbi:MAG: hypothetical protein HYS13_15080 [Planctomycetia bacterium]|nr:hypothetical protein [Planctomycetia bacterium]